MSVRMDRVHILGGPGAGTTTIGRAVADRINTSHFEADEFVWEKTDPPYQVRVPLEERRRRLSVLLSRVDRWVMFGSMGGWGDACRPYLDFCAFVATPTEVRLRRLRTRERARFGLQAISPGGVMHERHRDFVMMAAEYDSSHLEGRRNLCSHITWLESLTCPVVKVDGRLSIPVLVEAIISHSETEVLDPVFL